jgi:integrase
VNYAQAAFCHKEIMSTTDRIFSILLKEHRQRMFTEGYAKDWVFCDTEGGPLRHNNLTRRSFKPLLLKAGLSDVRFHDLRHTAATLMLGQKINPKVVQEILGHSNIAVTMDTYSHVLPDMQDEAATAMNDLLDRRTS